MLLNAQMFIKKRVLYVRLDGELDQHSVKNLRLKTQDLIERYHIKYLVLNFSKLSFMDSTGIGFIIGRYNRLKYEDGKVIICEMNEHISRIVRLSGLTKICVIKESEEEVNEYLGVA